jgi:succinate dehydrogenase/fumarate reductase cytochrome b subunit
MNKTKYWTWHMAAGVVLLFLLGLHMLIMHIGGIVHWFSPDGGEAISVKNSLSRDSSMAFTISYVFLLAVGLYHGLYGLRTILFELTFKPEAEKVVTGFLWILGLGLLGLGTWAAVIAHSVALLGTKG